MVYRFAARFFYLVLRVLKWTYRFDHHHPENLQKAQELSPNKSFIFSVWHQNAIAGILSQEGLFSMLIMVSKSKDGDLASYCVEKFGHRTVRGSSRRAGVEKGGKKALENITTSLKGSDVAAITVDGPKGPIHEPKIGILVAAKESQAAIVPAAPVANRYWTFNSWDKFRFPKPFSTIRIEYGEPFIIEKDATPEQVQEYREFLKHALDAVDKKAHQS